MITLCFMFSTASQLFGIGVVNKRRLYFLRHFIFTRPHSGWHEKSKTWEHCKYEQKHVMLFLLCTTIALPLRYCKGLKAVPCLLMWNSFKHNADTYIQIPHTDCLDILWRKHVQSSQSMMVQREILDGFLGQETEFFDQYWCSTYKGAGSRTDTLFDCLPNGVCRIQHKRLFCLVYFYFVQVDCLCLDVTEYWCIWYTWFYFVRWKTMVGSVCDDKWPGISLPFRAKNMPSSPAMVMVPNLGRNSGGGSFR